MTWPDTNHGCDKEIGVLLWNAFMKERGTSLGNQMHRTLLYLITHFLISVPL